MFRRKPEPDALNLPVNVAITTAEVVHIDVVSVNGCEIPDGALSRALRGFGRYVRGRIETTFQTRQAAVNEKGELTRAELTRILKESGQCPKLTIAIVVTQRMEGFTGRGFADHRGGVVLNACRMHFGLVRAVPKRRWWALVILHELLHLLWLPAGGDHRTDGHCTAPWCILYAKVDWRSILVSAFGLRLLLPIGLCGRCRRDLRQYVPLPGQAPVEDPELQGVNEVVRLNPDNPRAYATRADYLCRKRDDRAVADLTKAIKLGHPSPGGCYFNRGQMHLLAGRVEQARADFEQCLRLKPGHRQAQEQLAACSTSAAAGTLEAPIEKGQCHARTVHESGEEGDGPGGAGGPEV